MTKRKGLLDVKVDVRGLLEELPVSNSAASKARTEQPAILSDSILISNALDVITRQMKVSGNRSRTISDYVLHVEHFQSVTNVQYVADITANTIYKWLDSMNVSNQTRITICYCISII
ncbi:hypothetical protein UP17_17795 [Peribacillus simplex]|uniref:hypothetical protein n=1 Tax=Peribacillus simplex TaxID=1478 RepID=UPI000777EC6D|nr:hypothetical protein [Peribacillus simplex]AMM94103.1 hypothetical protein UP17_17795 [Peribacillus simplex]